MYSSVSILWGSRAFAELSRGFLGTLDYSPAYYLY